MMGTVFDDPRIRARIVLVFMLLFFALLGAMLWRIQVAQGHVYSEGLEKQSVRRVRLTGLRGRMFDRNGIAVVDNRPSHCLAVYLEELRQPGPWDNTIDRVLLLLEDLGKVVGRPPEVDRDDIWNHIRRRLPMPLLAWRDLDTAALARWVEQRGQTPGIGIYTESVRMYPFTNTACHALGYVGKANIKNESENPFHYYLPEMEGKYGLEKSMDALLRGEVGGELVRVDVTGYRRQDPALERLRKEPKSGMDIQLTLDIFAQQALEAAMGDRIGSAVVLDPRNGDVIALLSRPGFDPNLFYPGISQTRWNALISDPEKPLFNRAASGGYAPGSTFKPVVAMAALENGQAPLSMSYYCPGTFQLGRFTWQCANRTAHGDIGLQESLKFSCNVFYYKLGYEMGYEYIYHMASALGFGRKTGIELSHENGGLLPSDQWMRETQGHGWRGGDTVNASIGQGALSVTPLQMAVYTTALANRGKVYEPRLVAGSRTSGHEPFDYTEPKLVQDLGWNPAHIGLVRRGMYDVVMSDRGTGRRAAVPGVEIAGKTGTAEYGRKEDRKYRGWMIAFAPFEIPKYAISVVIDDATGGGAAAGPVIREFFSRMLGEAAVYGSVREEAGRG